MIVSLIQGKQFGDKNYMDLEPYGDDSLDALIDFYANSDEFFKGVIRDLVMSVNADSIVENLCETYKIGDISKLWIKAVLNYRTITILNGLESVRIDNDEPVRPNVTFSKRK